MGAWGIGIFDNDSALDWIDEIVSSEGAFHVFVDLMNEAVSTDYLDIDDASGILVFCAIIDYVSNGTPLVNPPDDIIEWVKINKQVKIQQPFKNLAIQGLEIVMSEKSELKELWAESEDYDTWKSQIQQMILRLSDKSN